MKCSNHPQTDALAVCVHCGCGICADCARKTPSLRTVCSDECAKAVAQTESTLASLRRKTLGGHRLTGYFCLGAGVILGLLAVLAKSEGQSGLFLLQSALAVSLAVSGFFYLRLANRNEDLSS